MAGMKLSTLEFIRLLPAFMRDDAAVRGLSAGLDEIIPGLAQSLSRLTTWDRIDELSEDELDDLAWELNILWYDKSVGIDAKREIVKSSDEVYRHLAPSGGGECHKFLLRRGLSQGVVRVQRRTRTFSGLLHQPHPDNEKLIEFLNLLQKVKRASSQLDGIFITLTGEMRLSAGMAVHEVTRETYGIGSTPI